MLAMDTHTDINTQCTERGEKRPHHVGLFYYLQFSNYHSILVHVLSPTQTSPPDSFHSRCTTHSLEHTNLFFTHLAYLRM